MTKLSTVVLCSVSSPLLKQPTIAESSELFSILYLKFTVYKVKRKGDRTVACGASVLQTTLSHSAAVEHTVVCQLGHLLSMTRGRYPPASQSASAPAKMEQWC